MSGSFDDTNRLAIPRCLDYATACALGLLRIAGEQVPTNTLATQPSQSIINWKNNPNLYTAVELLSEAIIQKDYESKSAIEAARYLLKKSKTSNSLIKEMANHFLEEPIISNNQKVDVNEPGATHKNIANLKKSLLLYDKNPIAWCDMALHYATLGQRDKAFRAINIALFLAPNNRFVLRSASRCFMHFGRPDIAVSLLNRSPLCRVDPWITSAEISIAELSGLPSKNISAAKDLVRNDNLTLFSRSELSVNIGTKEMISGAARRAKTHMRQGIIDPTENALAQAEWMSPRLGTEISEFAEIGKRVPASYEATARHLFNQVKFEDSLDSAVRWCRYQPLSSNPFVFSSYIASVCLEDHLRSRQILESALQLHRNEPMFMNNYICSLVKTGALEAAQKHFRDFPKRDLSDPIKFTYIATEGLLHFRAEDYKKGRELYLKAIMSFEVINQPRSAAIAAYYWAVEEKRISSPYIEERIKEAKSRVERYSIAELKKPAENL